MRSSCEKSGRVRRKRGTQIGHDEVCRPLRRRLGARNTLESALQGDGRAKRRYLDSELLAFRDVQRRTGHVVTSTRAWIASQVNRLLRSSSRDEKGSNTATTIVPLHCQLACASYSGRVRPRSLLDCILPRWGFWVFNRRAS